ncbi:MAG: hypothetical protein QQN63_03655 [Nitrosopumilus sp.]
MKNYKLSIPEDLYDYLNEGDMKVVARIRRGIRWVLLEDKVRESGGKIIIEDASGKRIEILHD